jgi:glycosyltransferase involved in cell wall biosynthesis
MARLAQSLARSGAEVEVLSLNPRKHHAAVPAAPVPLQAVDIDTSRVLVPVLRAMTDDAPPYIVGRFVSREFRDVLRATLRRFRPDVVQIESPFLLPYAADVRAESRARIVLRSLNVEFRIWESLARNERNPLRRIAQRRIAASLRAYEVSHLDTPDAIVPISAADAEDFRLLGCTRPMHVAPCGVTLPDSPHHSPEPWRAGFIGSLDFRPNQEAVEWIVGELWPRVMERKPMARLSIGGSSPPAWMRRRALGEGIEYHGSIDDAEAFLRRMSVVIAPLFAGGGMKIKVLEAMSLAKPVVATTLGARGIDVEHERNVVIADDAASFADGVVRLLDKPGDAARIGSAAQANVAGRYDNDAIARGLLEFYASL